MSRTGRHLRWRSLNRLADGELDGQARTRATGHVAACPKCRKRIAFLFELRGASRRIRRPLPPHGLLDEILADRAAGHRVILPAAPVGPPARRRRPAAVAAALLITAAGLTAVLLPPEAGAGASELRFDPPMPLAGREVTVEYRAGSALAGQDRLRLRARLRTPDMGPPRRTLGRYAEIELQPTGDNRFTGVLFLPDDASFAAFAVENAAGEIVDDRGGRLWEVLVHGTDDLPPVDALRQEFLVRQQRDWPGAGGSLREMTLLYPELAEGWSLRLAHDLSAELPEDAGASLATHREIFRRIQARALAPGATGVNEIAGLARYATELGELDARSYWLDRLEDAAPQHRLVLAARLAERHATGGPAAVLSYLEKLWTAEASRAAFVLQNGLAYAELVGNPDLVERWARRNLAWSDDHDWVARAAIAMAGRPQTREAGVAAARDLLTHLEQNADAERPLHLTRSEAREQSQRWEVQLREQLGRALLASGAPAAALQELDAADRYGGWSPAVHRTRFEARLAVGDTAAAVADLSLLLADPVYPAASLDSIQRRRPALVRVAAAGRAAAAREMRDRVVAGLPPPRPLPRATVEAPDGVARSLAELTVGRGAVLAFWDRRIAGSSQVAEELSEAADRLRRGPGRLVWITPEERSEALTSYLRRAALDLPPYVDAGATLAASLGIWETPAFYVVDRDGRIRARPNSLVEAVRLLAVLEMEGREAV